MAQNKTSELPGYIALGGTSRKYKTPTGKTISRRQYEKLRASTPTPRPTKTPGQIARLKASISRYGELVTARQQNLEKQGISMGRRAIMQDPSFKLGIAVMNKTNKDREKYILKEFKISKGKHLRDRPKIDYEYRHAHPEMYGPDSPLSQFLVDIGRREPDWDFFVGDTNTNE